MSSQSQEGNGAFTPIFHKVPAAGLICMIEKPNHNNVCDYTFDECAGFLKEILRDVVAFLFLLRKFRRFLYGISQLVKRIYDKF